MKRIALLVLLVVTIVFAATAEDRPPDQLFSQALGGYYGPIAGTGLHYHRWIGANGYQITGGVLYIPFGSDSWWSSTTLDYNIGGEYQRQVYSEAFTNWLSGSLYLFAGGLHRGFIPIVTVTEGYFADPNDDNSWVESVYGTGAFQAQLTAGFGIGVEIILFNHLSLPIEFGYGGTWVVTEADLSEAFLVNPYVQSGLRYRY